MGLAATLLFAAAEDKPAATDPAAIKAAVQKLLASLKPKQGDIPLRSGLARASIPPNFYYLGPEDAEKVLVRLWGNPPMDQKPLGLIYPTNQSLIGDNTWAVVIQYEEDGHIKDGDAHKIDYAKLLKEMQSTTKEVNQEREKKGYSPIELVGWATPPRYDSATHKLYWAKEIKFGDSAENTLNYNLRVLGRKGVLVLNAVSPMSRLPEIEAATPEILSMVDFNSGHRYGDFDKSTDKVATYGLAALVAGGVAAKAGLFKVIWVAILAGKKFIVLGVVAVFSFFKRLVLGRRRQDPPATV